MRSLHSGGLAANNLSDVFWQVTRNRLLVRVFSSVLAVLQPFQNRLIAAAQADFRVDPGAMQ